MASFDEIADAWWEIDRLTDEKPEGYKQKVDELWWAWETVEKQMEDASPDSVTLLVSLGDAAPTAEALVSLGAGPLWTLFFENGIRMATPEGASLLDAVAAASRRNEAFRSALSSLWYESDYVPEAVSSSIPGMPRALDERPPSPTDPAQAKRRKARRPGRPPPTRRPFD